MIDLFLDWENHGFVLRPCNRHARDWMVRNQQSIADLLKSFYAANRTRAIKIPDGIRDVGADFARRLRSAYPEHRFDIELSYYEPVVQKMRQTVTL